MTILPIFTAKRPVSAGFAVPDRPNLDQIWHHMHQALHDCLRADAQRIIYKINTADTPGNLWLLRGEMYQCISRALGQAQATNRVNLLLDDFNGWLPASQLTRIQRDQSRPEGQNLPRNPGKPGSWTA